jgi:hypothetical protein
VGFNNREDGSVKNPFAFPEKVSYIFFIDDTRVPGTKVVLRHEPRGKRTTEETDIPIFGAP